MGELAHVIARLMGHEDVQIEVEEGRLRPMDVQRLSCSYFKAMQMFGYRPKISLQEGLQRTIDWYRHNGGQWVWETKMATEDSLWQGNDCQGPTGQQRKKN